jgi:senataxin
MTKLVLVGDPEQLPPTVLSQFAAEKLYGQSLFERLYSRFKAMTHSPVMMLTTQYRMHPDICHFPNQHVYYGLLNTDREVAKKRQVFPFAAYTVFDLQNSTEELDPSGTSVFNPQEAEVTRMLCTHLSTYMKPRQMLHGIGIITPYQRQRSLLVSKLRVDDLSEIEVGTVDGFQGREKDVIILSCVRANRTNNIGFLGDRIRLNVSLTRARYALYVIGNLQTLQKASTDWSALVADAALRKRIVTISSLSVAEKMIREGCNKTQALPP